MATILCIDDELAALQMRRLVLEKEGHRVIETRSGEEGLRLLLSNRIDLVILDYWMSEMNGMKVGREIKKLNPQMPIIMLSGFAEFPDEGVGITDRWILKGNPQDLLNEVQMLLHKRSVS